MPKHAADGGVFAVAAAAAVMDAAAAAVNFVFVNVFESVFVDVFVDVFVFGIVGIIKMRGQPWHTRVWVGIFGMKKGPVAKHPNVILSRAKDLPKPAVFCRNEGDSSAFRPQNDTGFLFCNRPFTIL